MDNEKISVIAVEPGKKPYVQDIQSGLESLQREVGGDIQAVSPYTDAVSIICAEEGKLMGMPFNRALRDEDGVIYDVLVGKFLIVGLGKEDFISLPDNLIEKYHDKFKTPEMMIRMDGKVCIIPMEVPEKKESILGRLNEPTKRTPKKPDPSRPKSKGQEL